jgi:hypothetical protein
VITGGGMFSSVGRSRGIGSEQGISMLDFVSVMILWDRGRDALLTCSIQNPATVPMDLLHQSFKSAVQVRGWSMILND